MVTQDPNARQLKTFQIIAVVCFAALLARLFYLQVIRGEYYLQRAKDNMIRSLPLPAPRGNIFDFRGRILARNIPKFFIYYDPQKSDNPINNFKKLAVLLQLPPKQIIKLITQIKANPYDPVLMKKALDYNTLALVAEMQGEIEGIDLEIIPVRNYPEKSLAAHLLGYIGEINAEELETYNASGYVMGESLGKDGLEKHYEKFLRGNNGARRVQVDVAGKPQKILPDLPSVPGADLHLTLDLDVQKVMEASLTASLARVSARNQTPTAAAAVALKPQTGEIIALASLPAFNPNSFAVGLSQKEQRTIFDSRIYPLLNRVISCAYPCGSTFKLITASAALQEKVCTPSSYFYCPGVLYVGQTPFSCFVRSGHGSINFYNAIAQSCDVTFYQLGMKLGIERLHNYAALFGLGKPTGIDLPGETGGLLPDESWKQKEYHEPWYVGDTVNLSIGQGFLGVTPLQLAVFTAAVANDGYIYRPFIVKKITKGGKVLKSFEPVRVRRIPVAPGYFEAVRRGMYFAVLNGTGSAAHSSLVTICGKTGTAENFPCPDNPYGRNHAWFTSFAPLNNPELVVSVLFEKSGGFGGEWSAPVVKDIMETYFRKKPLRNFKPNSISPPVTSGD